MRETTLMRFFYMKLRKRFCIFVENMV